MRCDLRCLAPAFALLLVGSAAEAAPRCKAGKRPEVWVKSKTPIRRGPGLNYPVTSFLEKGRCLRLGEVSIDESWVLINSPEVFGWVPARRLSRASRKAIAKVKPSEAPVGSGQTRGRVWANRSAALRGEPKASAPTKKVLPEGARLLALAATGDGAWVQVRDERGEVGWLPANRIRDESGVLAGVPRTSRGVQVKTVTIEERVSVMSEGASMVVVPFRQGVLIDAQVLVAAVLPSYSLDTNGAAAFRRYDINAVAGGVRLEAATASLRPVNLRFGYGFTLLTGVAPEGDGGGIQGRHHEARIVAGLPIDLGRFWVVPEIGYLYLNADIDPVLPGDPLSSGGTFFSSRTSVASVGLSGRMQLVEAVSADVELAALLGKTAEYPLDLGEAGLTTGVLGGLGLRYAVGDSAGVVLRWDLRYRRTGYTGQSISDPSITEATLVNLDHGVFAGMVFAL